MRERSKAKERRKPAPRGKARRTVAGPSGPGESPPIGTLVDGRRFGSMKSVPFDEELTESGLASGVGDCGSHPIALWSDRGRQRLIASLVRGRQRRGEVAMRQRALAVCSLPALRAERTVVDRAEVGVQRQLQPSLGVGSPFGNGRRFGVAIVRVPRDDEQSRFGKRKPAAREPNGSWVLVARVGCRGRRTASSPSQAR